MSSISSFTLRLAVESPLVFQSSSGLDLDAREVARWAEEIVVAGFPRPGIRTVRVYEHPTTNKWVVGSWAPSGWR